MARDYTSEVGLSSPKKTFPRPVAYAILVVVAIGVSFGVKGVMTKAKDHHAAESAQTAAPSATPAPK
jgi:hypothetical protein